MPVPDTSSPSRVARARWGSRAPAALAAAAALLLGGPPAGAEVDTGPITLRLDPDEVVLRLRPIPPAAGRARAAGKAEAPPGRVARGVVVVEGGAPEAPAEGALFVAACGRFARVEPDGAFAVPLNAPSCVAWTARIGPDGRATVGQARRISAAGTARLTAPDGEPVSGRAPFAPFRRTAAVLWTFCNMEDVGDEFRPRCFREVFGPIYAQAAWAPRLLPRMAEAARSAADTSR